jgi:hypothetical protein
MSCLDVLPNFTIISDKKNSSYDINIYKALNCYCELISEGEYADTWKITPFSFWKGMNALETNFIKLVMQNNKGIIPENVLSELENFVTKFGTVELIGDDCLLIKDENLLEEVKNNSTLKDFVYNQTGNLIFFENMDIMYLQEVFQHEFNYPVKYHHSKNKTYIIWDGHHRYAVKAANEFQALKSFYNKHPFICEEDLRVRLNYKKEIDEEIVLSYIEEILENKNSFSCPLDIKTVSAHSIHKPIIL